MTDLDLGNIISDIKGHITTALVQNKEKGQPATTNFAESLFEPAVIISLIGKDATKDDVLPRLDKDDIIHKVLIPFKVESFDGFKLTDDDDHESWLAKRRQEIDWTHWLAYKAMKKEELPYSGVVSLDRITDEILDLLGNPEKEGPWDRRGLVMGSVQSGKTANYIGLINKAACAGYKVIIVLAGLHNNLRAQTAERIDEGVIGKDSRNGLLDNENIIVGVGHHKDLGKYGFHRLTSAHIDGDFDTTTAEKSAIFFNDETTKIFVVKKNKTPLQNLRQWLRSAANVTGNQKVTGVPLLVIDDEADQASINTGLESEPDDDREETSPSTINRSIRTILNDFEQSSYVGYTATPFANIFQAMLDDHHQTYGDDLFPRSFIKALSPPSNYFGPSEIFGTAAREGQPGREGLPLLEEISSGTDEDPHDLELWIPSDAKIDHIPEDYLFPESLDEALKSFILVCAARLVREGGSAHHNSMLIHVTRYVRVQSEVTEQVSNRLHEIKDGLLNEHSDDSSTLRGLESIWKKKFVPITKLVAEIRGEELKDSWVSFPSEIINAAVENIEVIRMSGKSKISLDYKKSNGVGKSYIAIGGDKLSRGLTLKDLSVSYYRRPSRMYDTLMQMGRWFGYRDGFTDLCRLWTTKEISLWYRHIATATEELFEEFQQMVLEGGSPRDYGLRVRSHPDMMVTNRMKLGGAEKVKVSFSGIRPETTVFKRSKEERDTNFNLLGKFVASIRDDPDTGISEKRNNHLFSSVSAESVLQYLQSLDAAGSYSNMRYPLSAVIAYIKKMIKSGGLSDWTVLIVSNSQAPKERIVNVEGYEIGISRRECVSNAPSDTYVVGNLIDPEDEAADLDGQQKQAALDKAIERKKKEGKEKKGKEKKKKVKAYGTEYRAVRPYTSGLLILYLVDDYQNKSYKDEKALTQSDAPFVGLCLSLPASPPGVEPVDYVLNPIAWKLQG